MINVYISYMYISSSVICTCTLVMVLKIICAWSFLNVKHVLQYVNGHADDLHILNYLQLLVGKIINRWHTELLRHLLYMLYDNKLLRSWRNYPISSCLPCNITSSQVSAPCHFVLHIEQNCRPHWKKIYILCTCM